MIRVLNVISGLNNAGTEAVVMNYYRNMDREKVQFDFLVLDTAKDMYYEKAIHELGGRIYKIPSFKQNPIKNLRVRKKFFKEHKYDIVEVHAPSVLRYGYIKEARKYGCGYLIMHVHSTVTKKSILINFARKQLEKYCDETVACSKMSAISNFGKEANKIVFNAIDYNKYKFDLSQRQSIREYYGIKDSDKVIGHIGRFSYVKNHMFLVEMFAMAAAQDNSLKLILKGFGELKENIINKVEELHIEDRVIFADEYDAERLYNTFDLFVMPSLYEGLAVVLIEAQANGLRIIGSTNLSKESNITGVIEFVELDKNEWVKRLAYDEGYGRENITREKFAATGYDIKTAAAARQKDYIRMVEKWSK